jgi:hypothetical protein
MVGIEAALAGQQQAAEKERRRRRDEEEIMTPYSAGEVEGWQFKIVRGNYKTAQQIEATVQEQAEFGWFLVEVFDQTRIRFKRPVKEAENDSAREGNPYATISRASAPGCGAALLVLAAGMLGLLWVFA